MPKVNVLKPFQPSPIQAELEAVRQCEAELTAADNEVLAIRARIEENAQAEQSARARLAEAQALARTPADMATMDAELERVEDAERVIAAVERQRGPLRHLLENAERKARVCLENLRDSKKELFHVVFNERKAALQGSLPDLEMLLEVFGIWRQAGHTARENEHWAAFLADLAGIPSREQQDAAYDHAPALVGLAGTASE